MEPMNIYALDGHKIKCHNMNAGYDHEQEKAREHLKIGNQYTVLNTNVGSWRTKVFLKEIPNIAFNSCFFVDVEKQSEEKDRLHPDWHRFNI